MQQNENVVRHLVNAITMLRINRKPGQSYLDYAQKQFANPLLNERLTDDNILTVSENFPTDLFLQIIIIESMVLSEDGLLTLLSLQKFDPDFCITAMDTYASETLVEALLGNESIPSSAFKRLAVHAMKSPYVKMLAKNNIAEQSGYDISVCKASGNFTTDIFNSTPLEMATA